MGLRRFRLTHSFYFTLLAGLCLTLLIGCGGRFSGPPGPAEIVLTAMQQELESGAETLAQVEVTDFSGRELPDAAIVWESSDPDIAAVTPANPGGHSARIVAGRKGGPVTITARSGTQSASLNLTVKGPQAPPISFAQEIQPIFTRSCALPDCHGPPEEFAAQELLLDPGNSYAQTVGVRAVQVRNADVKRIEPGDPDRSYLVAKIRGTHRQLGGVGAPMPLDGSLPAEDLEKIVRWVEAGAPNN